MRRFPLCRRIIIEFLVVHAFAFALVAGEPANLHESVIATYSFRPRDLNDQQLTTKSAELDRFWKSVKSQGEEGLAQLRAELARDDAPVFFRYDGAKLLLSLSEKTDDRNLALRSMARAELRDVQADDYFFTVHGLAATGLDTTAAALNILSDPEFTVLVPLHALTLNQDLCFLFMLLPTDETFYQQPVIQRLATERDPAAVKTLLTLLAYLATSDADRAIASVASDQSRTAEVRELASSLVRSIEQLRASPLGISLQSYASLKAARRRTMAHVSDEAIYEIERQTLRIRRKQPR